MQSRGYPTSLEQADCISLMFKIPVQGFIMLTQERLKELLHYDPNTGIFTNLIQSNLTKPKG